MNQLKQETEKKRLEALRRIRAACLEQGMLREASKELIKDSREIQSGRMIYNLPWDMEQCLTPYALKLHQLKRSPNGDPEWCYMLSRMEYLHKLYWESVITGDGSPLGFYRRFVLEDWYPHYAVRKKKSAVSGLLFRLRRKLHMQNPADLNRSLDVAVRIYALTVDQLMAKACGLSVFEEKLAEWFEKDVSSVTREDGRPFYHTSNMGVIMACSLILYQLLWKKKPEVDQLENELAERLKCQFSADGVHREDSPMYQVQVTLWLLRLCYWYREMGMELPAEIREIAEKSCEYLSILTGPDGYQQTIGDSDHTRMDSFFLLASYVLKKEEYLIYVKQPDDLCLFSDIPEALAHWLDKTEKTDDIENKEIPDGDVWKMRQMGSAVVLKKGLTMVTCLNTGHQSNHSHADSGSVLLYWRGNPVFVDSGRCTYVNCADRRELKGPRSHGILTFDNSPEWKVADAWVFRNKPAAAAVKNFMHGEVPVVCMTWEGAGAKFARYVLGLEEGILILDGIDCPGDHWMKGYFPLDVDSAFTAESDREGVLRCGQELLQITATGTWSVEKGIQSPVYQCVLPSERLVYTGKFSDRGWNAVYLGNKSQLKMEKTELLRICSPEKEIEICWTESSRFPSPENFTIRKNATKGKNMHE